MSNFDALYAAMDKTLSEICAKARTDDFRVFPIVNGWDVKNGAQE